MDRGFWDKLNKPFFNLAPMYDVTDSAFRQIIAKYGHPDVFYTEFVSCDGLMSIGREKIIRELYFTEIERPIVAQVFGADPETVYGAAKLIKELGFDGMDINMGCPDRAVLKQGAGANLITNPKLAKEIIAAAKEGQAAVEKKRNNIPISVKTRIGFNKIEFDKWLPHIIEAQPAEVTVHLRTKKELSMVPAHWELMPEVKAVFAGSGILLAGNGDVKDLADAKSKAEEYGIDGVMLGRAVFGNPWLYTKHKPDITEKLKVALEHTKLFTDLYLPGPTNDKLFHGHTKSFDVMKKHFKAYVNGFRGASELREKLYKAENAKEIEKVINNFLA
ncbi:MAG: tRNA-dihydrouridine synthase [bacterium]